jgi:hypothetical protein
VTELAITATVDRTSLGAGALALHDSSYRVVSIGPGSRRYKRTTADSDFVHGEVIVASTMKGGERILVVRCTGTSMANLWSLFAALETAFGQETYSVAGTVGGQAFSWTGCVPAEIEFGGSGSFNKFFVVQYWQDYIVTIPSDPVDTSGPI